MPSLTLLATNARHDADGTANPAGQWFKNAQGESQLVSEVGGISAKSDEGTSLPDPAATELTHFLLHSQPTAALDGWYRRIGTTHWVQVTSAATVNDSFGFGPTLPDAATTQVSIFLKTALPSTGLYERIGQTHWTQITG